MILGSDPKKPRKIGERYKGVWRGGVLYRDQPFVVMREATAEEWLRQERQKNPDHEPRPMHDLATALFYEVSLDVRSHALNLHQSKLGDVLLPLLFGRVFHVTTASVLEKILTCGEIRPNRDGEFESVFGSTNSYFRKSGCVSLFDYRVATRKQIDDAIVNCSPFLLPSSDPEDLLYEPQIAYLLLAVSAYDRVIPPPGPDAWAEGKIVPHVEAGFPGPLPVELIDEVIRVTIEFEPLDPLIEALRRGRRK
jgi:hypothetical protein